MVITIQSDVFTILFETLLLAIVMIVLGNKIKNMDPLCKYPKYIAALVWLVESLNNMSLRNVGKEYAKNMTPYLIAISSFIFISNIAGLFSISSPTANYSVTLTLALLTWIFQQVASIKYGGLKGYLHGFIEPIFLFLPMNIFGKFSSLLSMSLRLFGNILCGGIIMELVYSATGSLANLIVSLIVPGASAFNFVAPLITPWLHAYFDVFAGFIQTLIFVTLTTVFVGNEMPDEIKVAD